MRPTLRTTGSALIGVGLVVVVGVVGLRLVGADDGLDADRGVVDDVAADAPSAGDIAETREDATPVGPPPESAVEDDRDTRPDDVDPAPADTVPDPSDQKFGDAAAIVPEFVTLPGLDVRSELVGLGLNADRTIEVPEDPMQAGWYRYRPTPGEIGPAVIVGHVDSYQGPGIFYELRTMEVGDEVEVERSDGTVAIFVVRSVETHAKDAFPTERVYGDTDESVLRLVTCGGEFDFDSRSYEENVVVFADLDRIVGA